jgi:hypothetical protein
LSQVQPLTLDGQINGLATGHPKGTAGFRQQLNEPQPGCRRTWKRRVSGQDVKCQRLQGVAHQDGRCLVIGLVNRWPTATKVVIIHRGEIIVYEGIHVNQLNSAGRTLDFLFRPAYCASRSKKQRRPNAFAASEDAVPHSFVETRRHDLRSGKPRGQRRFHLRLPRFQLGAKSFAPA